MSVTELPKLYTEAEAAAYLGLSEATLARARRAGKIKFTRPGKLKVRYTAAHLAAYLEQQECGTTSGTTSKTARASTTSAGQEPMDALAANRLAREIARRPN